MGLFISFNALLAAIICLHASPAMSGDKGGDNKKAKELFVEASEFYKEGRYAQAVIRFHDAYDISPQSELLYNIAVCYEKMGQNGKAAEYYGKYLDAKEPDEAESEKIKKKVNKLRKKEAGEEEEEEEEGKPGKGWLKKLKLPDEDEDDEVRRGAWKHGLRFFLVGHLSHEGTLNYKEPGWSARLGYNLRFAKGKGSFIVEAGYGMVHENYFKDRAFHLALASLIFGWEILEVRKRFFQLFAGGSLEFDYFFRYRRAKDTWLTALGPILEAQLNFGPKFGLVFGFNPLFAFMGQEPNWAVGFLVKLGFVWGLK